MNRNNSLRFILVAAFVFAVLATYAQLGPPPPPPPPPPPDDGAPLGGELFLLLAAGIVYGRKKLYGKSSP